MIILGINAYHGDVSAVIVRDGQLIVALEEERFRRIKHYAGFPSHSIRACLDFAGVKGSQVDHVAISRDPRAHLLRKAAFVIGRRPGLRMLVDRLKNQWKVGSVRGLLAQALEVGIDQVPPVHNVEHHPAHLASAFFVSPFRNAAVCAIDGMGDFVSASMAVGTDKGIEVLDRVYFPHSLGILYTAVTQLLGFVEYGDEFKVMGLAPYGEPRYVDQVMELIHLRDGGRFELNLSYFRHHSEGVAMTWEDGSPTTGLVFGPRLYDLLGPQRDPGEPLSKRHEDIAHSVQLAYERCMLHMLNALHARTGQSALCLAGGCAMNSVANGKVRAMSRFHDVFIQPAAADNGTALGAAYYVWNQVLSGSRSFVMNHGYWGTEHREDQVISRLDELSAQGDVSWILSKSDDETCRTTARLIAEGNVVGWFQGRMEWGARALGNRSILADPRRPDMRDLINRKIKFREKFRPFAPSVLEERLHDYFIDAVPDPFMQQVYPIRIERRGEIPAVTHVDGSGRLQTVNSATNPKYHRLISEFAGLTGTPVLLNTSFNENEPIVDTPLQALDCFLRTGMDAIVIGNTIVQRRALLVGEQPAQAGDAPLA